MTSFNNAWASELVAGYKTYSKNSCPIENIWYWIIYKVVSILESMIRVILESARPIWTKTVSADVIWC